MLLRKPRAARMTQWTEARWGPRALLAGEGRSLATIAWQGGHSSDFADRQVWLGSTPGFVSHCLHNASSHVSSLDFLTCEISSGTPLTGLL